MMTQDHGLPDVRHPTYFLAVIETLAKSGALHVVLNAYGAEGVDRATAHEMTAIARSLGQTDPDWFQRIPYERWLIELGRLARERIWNERPELEGMMGDGLTCLILGLTVEPSNAPGRDKSRGVLDV